MPKLEFGNEYHIKLKKEAEENQIIDKYEVEINLTFDCELSKNEIEEKIKTLKSDIKLNSRDMELSYFDYDIINVNK